MGQMEQTVESPEHKHKKLKRRLAKKPASFNVSVFLVKFLSHAVCMTRILLVCVNITFSHFQQIIACPVGFNFHPIMATIGAVYWTN